MSYAAAAMRPRRRGTDGEEGPDVVARPEQLHRRRDLEGAEADARAAEGSLTRMQLLPRSTHVAGTTPERSTARQMRLRYSVGLRARERETERKEKGAEGRG